MLHAMWLGEITIRHRHAEISAVARTSQGAILEFNTHQLLGKLERAKGAIADRIREIAHDRNKEDERRALFDGLSILQGVKQDRLVLQIQKDEQPLRNNNKVSPA